jgi:hypothetical protein
MLNTKEWVESLSDNELNAFISWFKFNGVNSPEEVFPFLISMTSEIDLNSLSPKDLLTLLQRGKERGLKRIPEHLQYHITTAGIRLMKWCVEDDIQSQTINMKEYRRQLTEILDPLGFNSSYVFAVAFYTRENAIDETIISHKNRWPFPPHKLDHFYSLLLAYQFIEPSGHFKAMFLIENPPIEYRVFWKKNRTDLVYLGYRLYSSLYKDDFISVIDKVFYVKDKKDQVVTLQKLKKTNRNIREQISANELKQNWLNIDQIFDNIPLP